MYEFLFDACILRCLKPWTTYDFLFEAWIFIFLMYFKILYDFTILRSVFTIWVYFAFSVPCQKYVFNNLNVDSIKNSQPTKKHPL